MSRAAVAIILSVLALSTIPPVAAEPACYQGACAWDRQREEAFRARAESEGGALATPGETYTARVDELRDMGALRVLGPNVTAYNTTWALLVVRDHGCREALSLSNVSVPGYEAGIAALADAEVIAEPSGALALSLCGEQYAGIPVGSNATVGGGTLRAQTGRAFNLSVDFAGNATFPSWAGLVVEDTLAVTRLAPGSYLVSTTLRVTMLFEGELGWGSGTVRLDVLPAWERALVVTTTDCCASTQDVAQGAPRANTTAPTGVREAAQPYAERVSPLRACSATQAPTSYTCQAVAKGAAAPAIFTDRAADAWRVRARIAHEDVAAEYFGLCLGVEAPCIAAPGGASRLRIGGTTVAVEDRTSPVTLGPGGSLDRGLAAESARLDLAGAGSDAEALVGSLEPTGGGGSA